MCQKDFFSESLITSQSIIYVKFTLAHNCGACKNDIFLSQIVIFLQNIAFPWQYDVIKNVFSRKTYIQCFRKKPTYWLVYKLLLHKYTRFLNLCLNLGHNKPLLPFFSYVYMPCIWFHILHALLKYMLRYIRYI